jgi:hypothetical protein
MFNITSKFNLKIILMYLITLVSIFIFSGCDWRNKDSFFLNKKDTNGRTVTAVDAYVKNPTVTHRSGQIEKYLEKNRKY